MCKFPCNSQFRSFPPFRVSDLKLSLCSQIGELSFVFLAIKTRIIYAFWKVVTVSRAGHCWRRDTVQGRPV